MGFLGVYKAIYDYPSQNDQELALSEGDLLLVVEKSTEDEWWKAKKKIPASDGEEPVGLVPNNYIEEAEPVHRAKALYDYTRQTDEEVSLVEDAEIAVYDTTDPDWILVGSGGEYGFAPANYIELLETAAPTSSVSTPPASQRPETKAEPIDSSVSEASPDSAQGPAAALAGILQSKSPALTSPASPSPPPVEASSRHAIYTPEASDEEPPLPPPPPSLPVRPPPQQESSPPPVISPRLPQSPSPVVSPRENKPSWRDQGDHIPRSPGGYHLYNISEMVSAMGKRKKMPTTLGLNTVTGTIMISPEKSRDGPQQEWTGDKLTHYSIEGKHIFMELVRPSKSADFHAGAKDTAEEIVASLGEIAGAFRAEGLKEVLAAGSGSGQGRKRGHVLYDFVAQGDDEVTVDVGDLVDILDDTRSEEWWMVRRVKNGAQGVMPSSYVEVIKDAPPSSSRSPIVPDFYRSTTEKNRIEEERLAKQAVKSQQIINGSQSPPAEVGLGVKLPKRGSSLMSKDHREVSAAQARRRESKSDTKSLPPTVTTKPDRDRTRTWTDRSGSFKVEAEFVGLAEGKIHLHKLNGVKIAVPVVKMSLEDIEFVERIAGISLDEDKPLSDIKRRSQSGSTQTAPKTTVTATPEAPVQKSEKDETDWFDFFLKCGVPANLCVRYATSFSKDSMDESVLPDVGPDVLRTLGLKEGDILKVMKYLDNLYGRTGPNRAKRNVSFGGTEVFGKDEGNKDTRTGSTSESTGGLFAGPGGALRNNTRKGRPAPAVQTKDVIDPKVFEKGAEAGSKAVNRAQSNISPETVAPPPVKKDAVGFDDDAWSVKPAREQRATRQASIVASSSTAASQPSQPVLSDTMKELSLLSPPLQPTVTHTTGAQQAVQPQTTGLSSALPPALTGTSGGNQSSYAQPGRGQTGQQSPQRDTFQTAAQPGLNTQQFSMGPGNFQGTMPGRQRPQAPQQTIPNPAQFVLPPPPRPLSAPQNNSQQSGFAPPPLQPQLTGFQNSTHFQPRIAPPGHSLSELQQTMFQHPYSQPSQPAQPNTFVPPNQVIMPQHTGFVPQFQPSQTYVNGPMPGFGMVNPQQTGMIPSMAPQMTGAPQPPPMFMAPLTRQQPLRTGSINSFLPPALQPQPTGGPGGFGQGFNTVPAPPPPPPPMPSIPQHIPAAPLQPQKTGPAPPVRFGLTPEPKRLVSQPTGRRANLAQATPENPFGF
ncbi:MAG: cytoskeletal protein binding protein [Peltula sp. TS41687]|nr:MAG: cytoskeletal protein binding protein [Peltula sp. TS41687]